MADQTPKRPDIVKVAKTKRHIYLLEKVQKGKPLSRAELKELAKFENKENPPGVVDTLDQVAQAFNVTERTAQNWKRNRMPVRKDGKYDLLEVKAWHHARKEQRGKPKGSQGELFEKNYDARYRKAKAELAEIALAEKMGELIRKDEVQQYMTIEITNVKNNLLAFAKRIAPQLVALEVPEIEKLIDERILEILSGFHEGKFNANSR